LIDGVDVSMNGFLGAAEGDVWCGKLAVCVTATGEIGCGISVVLVLMGAGAGAAGFVSAMLGSLLASVLYAGKSREELEQFQAE